MATISLGSRAPLVLLLVATVAACDGHEPVSAVVADHEGIPTVTAAAAAGVVFGCVDSPSTTERQVAPGTGADANGNGRVCDEAVVPGVAESPVLTSDDVIVADPALDGAGN